MAFIIDQQNCSCCHRCRVHCPVSAIRFKDAKYWIDPEKCISCGTCMDVCHNECISDPENPVVAEPHDRIKLECDVVVVGGGASGLAAGAKAACQGANVIVLEKGKEVGGSAWYATGWGTRFCKWHKEAGMDDDREEICEKIIKKTGGVLNEALIRRLMQANGDFVDWLIDDHDLAKDYKLADGSRPGMGIVPLYSWEENPMRIDEMIGPGGGGWYISLKLLDVLQKAGGQILYHTAGKHLITDEDGKITGILAEDLGGEVEITCKAVVLAAGAFTRNKEIMAKMQPEFYNDEGNRPIHIFTCSRCTGDGVSMVDEIGGDIDYVNRRVNMFGPQRHPYPAVSQNVGMTQGLSVTPQCTVFDGDKRMMEVSDISQVPGRHIWRILNESIVINGVEEARHRMVNSIGVDLNPFLDKWREVLAEEAEEGSVVIADTLEELADKLGFDRATFRGIVEEYNENVKKPGFFTGPDLSSMAEIRELIPKIKRKDAPGGGFMAPPGGGEGGFPAPPGGEGGFPAPPGGEGGFPAPPGGEGGFPAPPGGGEGGGFPMFGEGGMPQLPAQPPLLEGPFYAFRLGVFHENAMGGIANDENMNAMRNGVPIPGLYAVGDNSRGIMLSGDVGVNFIEYVLSALTYSLDSGYVAGIEAAKYAAG